MKRVTDSRKSGTRIFWACTRHLQEKEACPMKRVLDEDVKNTFLTMMNKLYFARNRIIPIYEEGIRREELAVHKAQVMCAEQKLIKNTDEIIRLTTILKTGGGEPVSIRREMYRLEEENEVLRQTINGKNRLTDETSKLKYIISAWESRTEWDEATFAEVVETVCIHQGESICFQLKCGMVLTEKMS